MNLLVPLGKKWPFMVTSSVTSRGRPMDQTVDKVSGIYLHIVVTFHHTKIYISYQWQRQDADAGTR